MKRLVLLASVLLSASALAQSDPRDCGCTVLTVEYDYAPLADKEDDDLLGELLEKTVGEEAIEVGCVWEGRAYASWDFEDSRIAEGAYRRVVEMPEAREMRVTLKGPEKTAEKRHKVQR